jgi:hypothetical protein
MSTLTVCQRVYRNKGNHRHIGLVTAVDHDHVRVLWTGAAKPRGYDYRGLTVISIRQGATVVRGNTSPAQPISALSSPLFGIVTNISMNSSGGEDCTVTWDDRTVTTQPTQEVLDINWIPPVPLGDLPLTEWLTAFEAARNIDFTCVRAGTYRCARNSHVTNCLCHSDSRDSSRHNILPSCMCQFRITVLDNSVVFSGTHVHHIPGTHTFTLPCGNN